MSEQEHIYSVIAVMQRNAKKRHMGKLNHGTDTRPDGYYRVRYQGTWYIALWEKTARGRGWWLLPGVRDEKLDTEFDEIDEKEIDPQPKNQSR